MISEKSFEEVISNLEKYKLIKTKLSKLKLNDIYLESIKNENKFKKMVFIEKLELFYYIFILNEVSFNLKKIDFQNKNDNYPMQPDFEKYINDYELEQFDKDYNLYILKNEYFGYDSNKINLLDNGKKIFLKYPFFEIANFEGFRQTFILVKTSPVDSKAEFHFQSSNYCHMIYGDSPKTSSFTKNIGEVIKNIFGWPIINYRLLEESYDDQKYFLLDAETKFNIFIKNENIKEVKYNYILKNFIDPKLKYSEINKKNFLEKISKIIYPVYCNFLTTNNKFTRYNFWEYKDLKYLKFFILEESFFNIDTIDKNAKFKNKWNSYENNYWNTFSLKDLAFKKNIIVVEDIKWPILIWDQRNFRKPFYKFIIPSHINFLKNLKDIKKLYKKIFEKIENVNQQFAPYWKIFWE
ncbi:hypothetical protein ACW95P_03545 [Candidatus Mycoplasma pogonae]